MNIITVTPPTVEPVTLIELYGHLRLDPVGSPPEHPDDNLLRVYRQAAREDAEKFTRRSFVYQTLRAVGNSFPGQDLLTSSAWGGYNRFEKAYWIELLRPPVLEVLAVRYYDGDNALQTVSVGDYYVTDDEVPRLMFGSAFSTPTLYGREDAVRVDYRTGYLPAGSPADDFVSNVPAAIKAAILIGVQLLYDDLTPQRSLALQNARDALLSSYVIHSV